MSCEKGCFQLIVKCCDSPKISVGLTADTTYQVTVNRVGNTQFYKQEVTTDNTGAFEINKSTFPAGYFAYGYLNVTIATGSDFETVQPITQNGIQYNCLLLELVDIEDL